MPASRHRSGTHSSTDSTTDNRQKDTDRLLWDGGTTRQASWLNKKLKDAEADFDYSQLSASGTVTLNKSGLIAVFSPEHALEHAEGQNQGTMRAPNTRTREHLLARSLARQPVQAQPPLVGSSGGHPAPTPSPTVQTLATTPKAATMLEEVLGELGKRYVVSPESIEKLDLEYLNFFLDDFMQPRMAEKWRTKCDKKGTMFVRLFFEDMATKPNSVTNEETIETEMRKMLENGLQAFGEVSFSTYIEFIGAYDELNEVRKHKIDEESMAHQFKRLIMQLSPAIGQAIELRIALIESLRQRNGIAYDAVEIVNEAASFVLEEESNKELLKQVKEGRAFLGTGFDPQRNQREPGARPPGGQTWSTNSSGPDKHMPGMRDCTFCTEKGTVDVSKRNHVDLKCPYATKEQIAALTKERADRSKAKKDAWRDRTKKGSTGSAGGAKLAGATDDADAAACDRIFNGGVSSLIDLGELIDMQTGSAGHAMMTSKAAPRGRLSVTHSDQESPSAPASIAGSVNTGTTLLSPSVAPSSASMAAPRLVGAHDDTPLRGYHADDFPGAASIYVIASTGNDEMDNVMAGVWHGNWQSEIVPAIRQACHEEQIVFGTLPDVKELRERSRSVKTLELAVRKCNQLNTSAIFMGPRELIGSSRYRLLGSLRKGDDVEQFVQEAVDVSDPKSDSNPDDSEGDPESEPESDPDAWADELIAEVEVLSPNTHVDIIRALIARNGLHYRGAPISPGTGGLKGRTKFDMLQEVRQAVGAAPLPDSALRGKRAKPDVPMGKPVDKSAGRRINFGSPAARPAPVAERPACGFMWMLPVMLAQLFMVGLSMHANGNFVSCRTISPSWVCASLGYADPAHAITPNTVTPKLGDLGLSRDDGFARDPGAQQSEQVGRTHLAGLTGSQAGARILTGLHLLLPALVCLFLLLHSFGVTVKFAQSRLARSARAWVARKDPLRATTSPRDAQRHVRDRHTPTLRASSRFLSTLGEAPLWLSLVLLVHEIAVYVVPYLFALSIGTLLMGLLRCVQAPLIARDARAVYDSWLMTPARVLLRIAMNIVVITAYLGYHLLINTFVSESSAWPPARLASSSPSRSRLGAALATAMVTVRALLHATCMDLRRWGGVALDNVFTSSPTPTDPSKVKYVKQRRLKPRALHAFNDKASISLLARSVQPPDIKVKLDSKRSTGRAGRALLAGQALLDKVLPASTAPIGAADSICWGVIDSGCSWHCHPHIDDLINRRPCNDTMAGIDGKPQRVKCIGDLPALARDSSGVWRRIIIRDVRCVPSFTDTLISVDQFWEESKVNCIFADVRCIHVPGSGVQEGLDLPFARKDNLYRWAVIPANRRGDLANSSLVKNDERALKATIHRPKSTSFFNALSPDEQLDMLHRRLHVGFNLIRRLGEFAVDIPVSIKRGKAHDCDACKTANATRVPHPGKSYQPSHVGRLIHGDLAGPFKRSHHGFFYFLVLVDDHSRFKQVYFLKHKSEALKRIRSFVAKLNALASIGKPEPVRIVGQLHMDNAGEFLSHEFNEYLDSESITRTTCPPHVHQLNGVAERSIRSIMEIVRATRDASQCPIGFWPHLVEHAVDVLNRTTGPPIDHDGDEPEMSSYQHVTGKAPKILTILPLGCRAYAVKPQGSFSKSSFDSRAWAGINLGSSSTIPGAYNIWLPMQQKVIQTSEVYFDESLFPWRPDGQQRVGSPPPVAAPTADPEDISAGGASPDVEQSAVPPQQASNLPEAFASATRASSTRSFQSIRILLLFSGAYNRPDGLAQFARRLGLEVDLFDSDPNIGGGDSADITKEAVYEQLRERIVRGEYAIIIAAPPCSTFSISRFFKSATSPDGGPPPVRTRVEITGCRFLPSKHRAELERANNVVNRMCALLLLAHRAGTEFIIENPADRGDVSKPELFINAMHGPLWLVAAICALTKQTSARAVTFAMCAFGAPWQKYTTLLYSAGFSSWLDVLRERTCEHTTHAKIAGGTKTKSGWNSNEAAAYPPDFNSYIAQAAADLVKQRRSTLSSTAAPHVTSGPDAAIEMPSESNKTKGSSFAPQPKAPAPAETSVHPKAPAPAETLGVSIDLPTRSILDPGKRDTSIRQPSFADENISHEEPDAEELPNDVTAAPPRKRVVFEKTAGARATRSQKPVLARAMDTSPNFRAPGRALVGLGVSAGFAMAAMGMSVASSAFVLGTTNFFDEIALKKSSLRAALAKPSTVDPKNQTEAYASDKSGWQKSETKELKNHADNGSWEYIDASQLPRGRRLVKLVWVYKVKRDGSLKSRLCVQGCRQVPGVDYDQTWCGAMRGTSLRMLSNLAASAGMRMRRYDFVAAYLQGELLEGETVYCFPPPGYERKGADGRNQICRILKPVYGMAQAGRRWQRTLFPWLKEFGFTQTDSDPSVFTLERTMDTPKGPRLERIHVGVYVDDLATVYLHDDEHSLYRAFITALETRWNVEDEGELTDLLGIEFTREEGSIELRQTKYIEKLAAEFFPDGVPPTAQANKVPCDRELPALVHLALLDDATPDPQELRRYQSICGALLYASTNTRPDIAFSTGLLCRAMGRPTPELYQAALRVLGYLYRNRHIGLRYTASDQTLEGFSDSDWAVKHSTSGFTFHLGSATVSWSSKKQTTVALSSCEAEIMAGSEAAKEAIYLSTFLRELGMDMSKPPPLRLDNKSAIDLAYNPEHHSKTKHIERRHYFIRECVENGKLRVPFVPTADNVADFFTKPLTGKMFFDMRDKVMNVPRARRDTANEEK